MVLIHEYRIPMPVTTAEYQIGQLFGIAELSKEGSGKNGEGVEVVTNEPFENSEMGKGQYTHKIYHVGASLPGFVSAVVPTKMLDVHEEAWNAFPYCKTVITCPFLGDRFSITLLTIHKDNDTGNTPNIHNLPKDKLSKRKIVRLDIANDEFEQYKKEDDPKLCRSEVANRGPLTGKDWVAQQQPIMCCYKLVTVECKIWGLQSKIESKIQEFERSIFLKLHRKMFCSMDAWANMTMDEVRLHEKQVEHDLKQLFAKEADQSAEGKKKRKKSSAKSTTSSPSSSTSNVVPEAEPIPVMSS